MKSVNGKKVCSSCHRELTEADFYKNISLDKLDGLANECKDCMKKRASLYRQGIKGTKAEELIKDRIVLTCKSFNEFLLKPVFVFDSVEIGINNLADKEITLKIPLRKNMPYMNALSLLEFAINEIEGLDNKSGEVRAVNNKPTIVIRGVING